MEERAVRVVARMGGKGVRRREIWKEDGRERGDR